MAITTQTHNSFASNLALGQGWGDGVYKALLVNTSLVGLDPSLANVGDVLAGPGVEVDASTGYTRQDVTGCALVDDGPGRRTLYQADPVDFGSPAAALGSLGSYDMMIIYFNSGSDATSWILGSFDLSDSGSLRDTDGNPIIVNPDPDGWFALTST